MLAGGQSLVPLLNLRLAQPELVVDINGVGGARLHPRRRRAAADRRDDAPGALERSELVRERWPLLHKAVAARRASTRSGAAGTVGGSVAHADPAAELPVALIALGARFHLRSPGGTRALDASELFLGPLYTAREPDELLVEVEVPEQPDGAGHRLRGARAHPRRLRDGGGRGRGRPRRARRHRPARRRSDPGARRGGRAGAGGRGARRARRPRWPRRTSRTSTAARSARSWRAARSRRRWREDQRRDQRARRTRATSSRGRSCPTSSGTAPD